MMGKRTTTTRHTDSKGRVTLGESFANRTVLMERRGNDIIIRLARVIPEREAWLYDNKEALAQIRRGLNEARSGKFTSHPPDLNAAADLADQLPDE